MMIRHHLLGRQLVADRNVGEGRGRDLRLLVQNPSGQGITSLDSFDYDDSDRVTFIVHDELNHLSPIARRPDNSHLPDRRHGTVSYQTIAA